MVLMLLNANNKAQTAMKLYEAAKAVINTLVALTHI